MLSGEQRFYLPAAVAGHEWSQGTARSLQLMTEGLHAARKSSIIGFGRPQLSSDGAADADAKSSYGGHVWATAADYTNISLGSPTRPAASEPKQHESMSQARRCETSETKLETTSLNSAHLRRGAIHPPDSLVLEDTWGAPAILRHPLRHSAGTGTAQATQRVLLGGDPLPRSMPAAFLAERRGGGEDMGHHSSKVSTVRFAPQTLGSKAPSELELRKRFHDDAERRSVINLPVLGN